jgi:hypothetical protein
MKTLINSEDLFKKLHQIPVPAPFPAIGRFSPVFTLLLDAVKIRKMYIGGFHNNFQDHRRLSEQMLRVIRGYQKAGANSLKRVP